MHVIQVDRVDAKLLKGSVDGCSHIFLVAASGKTVIWGDDDPKLRG